MRLSIPESEIKSRQRKLITTLQEKGVDGAILFSVTDIFYLTGFHFRPSERPIAFFIDPQENTHILIPHLEKEHAEEYAFVQNIHYYPEYPGLSHPMEYLKESLLDGGLQNKVIGLDAEGYTSPKGYHGSKVRDLIDAQYVSIDGWVEEFRQIKSNNEIELIKESCRWGNLAHRLLHKYSKVGLSEIEISGRATLEATTTMIETLGKEFLPHGEPTNAFYRGQIGQHSNFPHSQTQNLILKKGDNVVSQSESTVWGYRSELERTMFVREVSKEQEKYYRLVQQAQKIAVESIKPGQPFNVVEKNVRAFYEENNVEHLTRHHTGHNIGLLNHEAPFFDLGDQNIMKPGMVATVEPALYVENIGGFRNSDTILITEDGCEFLTYYPRDLESLIIQ
ncbi:putative dipeptidase YkvY [Thalassobacillus devorans]|uniref:Dipeptidase YkvY n=1 Tax=Thalassobacillus devorans TaxID=279813 RepID=A0ABQ1NZ01_9BACI|nr:Xaa-Pro peptidase family protein [Thalassobacillus devorans]NIK28219.1 Xaa-Pro aminopeptidase [Thalassobacillus devorans]GGC87960.1 putative dipeptidase YkvY [Thalassobacillus devorans]